MQKLTEDKQHSSEEASEKHQYVITCSFFFLCYDYPVSFMSMLQAGMQNIHNTQPPVTVPQVPIFLLVGPIIISHLSTHKIYSTKVNGWNVIENFFAMFN